jgi:cell division protein FtsB
MIMLKMTKIPMVMMAQFSIFLVVLSNSMIIDYVIIVYYKSRTKQMLAPMIIKQFKSRRKTKRLLYSPVTVIVLTLVLVVLARSTWSIYEKYLLSSDRLDQAESQLFALKNQEGQLSQSIAQLSTASGTEAVMRTNFRIIKPGESLAVLVNTATTAATTTAPEGFWGKLGEWFGKVF